MSGLMLNVLIAEKMQKENQILCQDGLEVADIGLDTWMLIMIKSLFLQKRSSIGRM
jgi:predicted ATPase